jgi:mannan endo-1,4-beta-mannosidase
MKKTALALIFTILWFAYPVKGQKDERTQGNPTKKTYEAEDGTQLDGILLLKDTSASGGKFLRMKETGTVVFHLEADREGRYTIGIGYRSPGKDNAQRILINGREYAPEIGFLASSKWAEIEKNAGLTAGDNTIEVRKSWGNIDIDYITVYGPIFERPEITPVTNTFYKNQTTSDLFIKLDKNNSKLISITQNQQTVPFVEEKVSYTEDGTMVKIRRDYLSTLDAGNNGFLFNFSDIEQVKFNLEVRDAPREAELTIVSLDVSHGVSVLMILPTGKTLLIDTGTEQMCKERVIPFLERHQIKPDYLWITHYHDDHAGGEGLLMDKYKGLIKKDYKDFNTGDQFEFEKMNVTILNSYKDGEDKEDENYKSLSMRMEYKGFVYTHGGDIYGQNQHRILQQYAKRKNLDFLKTHVYHANHHFHGSVDEDYLKTIDPYLFIVSGEEHIYGRGAFTQQVQRDVEPYLKKEKKRFIEDLLSFEVGHIVIRVADGDHWNYETYKDINTVIPFLTRQSTKESNQPVKTKPSGVAAKKPVTPNATTEAVKLLEYLYSISGKQTLVGQHCAPLVVQTQLPAIEKWTGHYPALCGFDFGFGAPGTWDGINFRQNIVDEAIRRNSEGFIITIMWHAVRPIEDEPVVFRESVQGKLTDKEWEDLITTGTEINERWKSQVDVIAFFLKQLKNADVPVLWRPYHEINGGWFWWNGKPGDNGTKKLYRMLYDRLVKFHKLNNLIWVYNCNEIRENVVPYDSVYPGDDVVDILATDVYRNAFDPNDYNQLLAVAGDKPIALGEVGTPPTSEQLREQPRWTWFMVWGNLDRRASREIYDSNETLTWEELPWIKIKNPKIHYPILK